jgi:hypothetical protein
MGAPHNTKRYGEQWNLAELAAIQTAIELIREPVVVSGGWAWHFMTPEHTELKHAHDHKDLDAFVTPERMGDLVALLKGLGFEKTWTRHDGKSDDFHRYTVVEQGFQVILDLYTGDVPKVTTRSGVTVVEPMHLISLYGTTHQSKECFSFQIAKELLAKGIAPVGRPEMSDYSRFLTIK